MRRGTGQAARLASFLALSGACAARRDVPERAALVAAPPPSPPRSAVVSREPGPSAPPLVEVVRAFEWRGMARILGVDPAAHQVSVWLESVYGQPPAVEIDTVDDRSGEIVRRWAATEANAAAWVQHPTRFHPLTGALDADLARLAALLDHADVSQASGLALVPSGRLLIYTIDPAHDPDSDGWMVADRSGRPLFELAPRLRASYSVAFSPDGSRAAWSGCEPFPGDSCAYHLYLGALGGPPVRVDAVPQPGDPFFGRDGETVFASAQHPQKRACLHRVPYRRPSAAVTLHCTRSDDTPYLVPDPTGDTAVLATPIQDAEPRFEYTVLRLPDGAVEGTYSLPGALLAPVVGAHHRLFTQVSGWRVAALDLGTGRRGLWTEADLGGYIGHLTPVVARGAEALVALRLHGAEGRLDLVRLNLPLE